MSHTFTPRAGSGPVPGGGRVTGRNAGPAQAPDPAAASGAQGGAGVAC